MTIKIIIGASIFISFILLLLSLKETKDAVPEENRRYMDPIPKSMKVLWPLVNIFAHYVGSRVSVDKLEKYNIVLQRSGLSFIMTPEQFVGVKLASAVAGFVFSLSIMYLLQTYSWGIAIAGLLAGYFLPTLNILDLKKKRVQKITKALPTFLDYLTMSVQAGLNMTGAIQQSVDKGPDGPLRVEFEKVLRDIKAGMSRLDALRAMAERNEVSELNAFVTSVIQADKTGASIGNTLKVQADQRRIERFQRAEKLAMEAPVKLIFPLVAFIFPMTFLALFFPIVMKFIHDV